MAEESHQAFLDLALRLATDATDLCQARQDPRRIEHKADSSLVTALDHELQAALLVGITGAYPDHAVIAEERRTDTGRRIPATSARYCWVVDPLDGTRNYASGIPCYATAIAVLESGEPVVGLIKEHNTRSVYAAVRGGGATLNGRTIRVAEPMASMDALIGIPSSKDKLTQGAVQQWVSTRGLVVRNLGSSALHLALVGSGALNAAFCKRCKIWDVAAGALIVTEAGGVVTDVRGRPITPFDLAADVGADLPTLASAPAFHAQLLRTLTGGPSCR